MSFTVHIVFENEMFHVFIYQTEDLSKFRLTNTFTCKKNMYLITVLRSNCRKSFIGALNCHLDCYDKYDPKDTAGSLHVVK